MVELYCEVTIGYNPRRAVPEEERRADDMAAVRHPPVRELAARCIVDDEETRVARGSG